MGDFFAELRRRHIYRIGAGYVVVAWVITQVVEVLSQLFAPLAWIAQPVVITLAIGFPIVLIGVWLIEGNARQAMASAVRSPAATVDWVLAGAVVMVIGLIGYQQFAPRETKIALPIDAENVSIASVNQAEEVVSDVLPNSIAVLPFENLSPDPDNAYFAAGVHEEVLNQLAKIRDLNVIARTSVLQYPDSGKAIPEIADELNVEMVMEGSVRYGNDQVRVTAQLIDGATNTHLWTEAYDGDLSDVFGIQGEIAMNIANSLQAEFSIAEQENIERAPTNSPEAYAAYLRALAEINGGGVFESPERRSRAQSYLDEALALDSEFASAHAWKALLFLFSRDDLATEENLLEHRAAMDQFLETHANMALALDPSIGLAHAALAFMHFNNWRAGQGLIELEQALRLSPNDPMVVQGYAYIELSIHGRPEEAVRYWRRAIELDPNNISIRGDLAYALHLAGRYAEAIEILQLYKGPASPPQRALFAYGIAKSEFARGNRDVALDELRAAEEILLSDPMPDPEYYAYLAYGYGLLEQPADAQRMFEGFRELAADGYVYPSTLAVAHMGIGDYDEALTQIDAAAENLELQVPMVADEIRLNGWSDPILEQPEWVEVRNRLGFRE